MPAFLSPAPRQGFPPVTLSGVPCLSHSTVFCLMLSVKTLFEHAPSNPHLRHFRLPGEWQDHLPAKGLLAYTESQGLKPAILMNDYGDVSTDSDRLRGQGWPTKTFADGCICCTLRPDLHSALTDIMTRQPDVIFIEATGLADPVRLLDQLTRIEMLSRAFVAAMIAVIDARGSSQQMAGYGLHSFTETADFVLINKCDLAHWMQLARTAQEVRHKNSRAKMLLTTYAEVDFAEVLSQQGTQAAPTPARAPQHDHFHTLTYRAPCFLYPGTLCRSDASATRRSLAGEGALFAFTTPRNNGSYSTPEKSFLSGR